MRITFLRVRNFRGIRDLDIELGNVTVLIGENNSGKTSVLDALKLCLRDLGPRRRVVFDGLDFHLVDGQSEPSSADPIEIEVRFSDTEGAPWGDELVARLARAGILQTDGDRSHVRLRVTCDYDRSARDFSHQWQFLDLEGDPLSQVAGRALAVLQDEVRYYYLSALRDASRHFDAKGPFWRPFLQDSELSVEKKAEIEERLREVNELVVSSHASFEQVQEGLRRVQSVVPLASGQAVSIEAVPNRMFDMLAKAQVQLGTSSGARIPLRRHGEGTQSLSVLMLFSAFLEAQSEGAPVLALEEPEAHLHPSAIRALWGLVRGFSGQKLVSTHSGDLLAETDIRDIRRLAQTEKGIRVFQVGHSVLTPEETRKFNYHIRLDRGELLFARCWLLVEGQTESWVYPAAARALGLDVHREGVRVVEFSQSDVGMLTKVANALGIPWFCVGDDDGKRKKVEPRLKENLVGADDTDRVAFPYRNIETHLTEGGYREVYGRHRKGHKTRAAAEVAVEMENRGKKGVTPEIRSVLEKVVSLAGIGWQ